MKYLILILLGLSLVGLSSIAYAEVGDFIDSFNGAFDVEFNFPFDIPVSIAVDSNDRIIVADSGPALVHIFDSNGGPLVSFDGSGTGGVPFSVLGSIAVASNDRIIVTDIGIALVQIFDSNGDFLSSFDGSIGGLKFYAPVGIAVDSNDRIIVSDFARKIIQIFDSNGVFLGSFDGSIGGTKFLSPIGIAVDSNDRIIVTDDYSGLVQIFDSDGIFLDSFDGTNGGGIHLSLREVAVDSNDNILVTDINSDLVRIFDSTGVFITSFDGSNGGIEFIDPTGIAVDSNDRILVSDVKTLLVQIFEGYSVVDVAIGVSDKNGSGCSGDCTPPTIGLDKDGKRLVDNGFSYNNNPVDVIAWHTPYPLITAIVNQTNTVEITVYENQGIFYLDMVQFGLGLEDFGQAIHDVEVLIEVHLEALYSENTVIVEKVVIRDRDNLIDTFSVFAVTDVVPCIDDTIDEECLKITLQYSYREATFNNMMVVNVMDISSNSQNFYLNDGVEVIGESMNPAPTYTMYNKKISQQTENLILTLTRTDKINHIWMDEDGVEYLQISNDRFDRITPFASMMLNGLKINQDPLQSVQSRVNSNFDVIVSYEKLRAVQHFDSSLIQGTLDDSIGTSMVVHVVSRLEKLGDNIEIEQVKAQVTIDELLNPMTIYR